VSISYVGGTVLSLLFSPIIFIVAAFLTVALMLLDQLLQTGLGPTTGAGFSRSIGAIYLAYSLVLAGAFWGLAKYFLADAQKWVADRERTRHWKDEYRFRRPRRRVQRSRPH